MHNGGKKISQKLFVRLCLTVFRKNGVQGVCQYITLLHCYWEGTKIVSRYEFLT